MSDMPAKILARPMTGISDRHCGPWALDDPYKNSVEYHHSDAVNALVEAATRAQHLLDGGPATGQDASKWTNELRAAIAAIKGPAE